MTTFANHDLAPDYEFTDIKYELRPLVLQDGTVVDDLFNAWIWLDNPEQYNAYTTRAMAELVLALRRASSNQRVVCVVFTAVGEKAFCTGGNTAEYSEHYSGRPDEYRRYMRLFNDGISALMECDKPVINRVNGMRIAGGQEIGMACDFTGSVDTARFGQAGPKHGSAPVGGSTDYLPVFVGIARAVESCALCEPWSAHYAQHIGLLNGIVPSLKIDGKFIANPMAYTEFITDEYGRSLYGQFKTGADRVAAKEILAKAEIDFSLLDKMVNDMCAKLANTMPDCTVYTLEQLRKHKLMHWDKNRESNRAWLGLNMMTEGRIGFRTFNRAPRSEREADFIEMRRALAEGVRYGDNLAERCAPYAKDKETEK
ncbi:MAG TPA: 6-oxocyclohex-1-ene-1-carbonyl-CoA hydratase [Planctomycetes bacterium]|nr:6-oxocyclohex-1-ene-1-carbonyl-CoA hydratase [Planctomycetota bacterium]